MKLTFHTKSGNKIVQRGVREYEFQNRGNEIVGVTLRLNGFYFGPKLLLGTMDISQIEAVTVW